MKPIDLKTIAEQNRWKLDVEESSQHSAKSSRVDPWLLIIPCQNGHLYCHSADLIGVSVESAIMRNRLKQAGLRCLQDGDDGANFAATLEDLPRVAELMKPRRKRVLTTEQRKRLVAVGQSSRYTA